MTPASTLFRDSAVGQAAEETLFSDSVRIVGGRLRVAIVALLAGLCIAVAWSAVFTVPIAVTGRGLLLAPGGLADIASDASGQMRSLDVQAGDMIAVGQVVARIDQPDLRQKLALARADLAEQTTMRGSIGELQSRDNRAAGDFRAARIASLDAQVAALGSQRAAMAERVRGMEGLAARGLVSRERLQETRLSLIGMEGQIADARNERVRIASDAQSSRSGERREMIEADRRVSDAQRTVTSLQDQLERSGVVRSPFAGRVVEVKASVGQTITAGMPVMTLERATAARAAQRDTATAMALVYVSAADGKKLRPGMGVAISPATTQRQEDGEIVGRVVHVSDTPASSAGMLHRLQNDQLVQVFTQTLGAPFEVEVALTADPVHPGRPRWTTGRQPAARIDPGTLVEARFTIRRMPLLAFAIPALARGGRRDR